MSFVGRRIVVTQVWLTAVMTLVAGLPHFDCRCPNGQVKLFCLSLGSKSSGCCCGGTCCSTTQGDRSCCRGRSTRSAGREQDRPCCRQHQSGQTTGFPSTHYAVRCTGCARALAQPTVFAPSPGKTAVNKDMPLAAILPLDATPVSFLSLETQGSKLWQTHSIAPPTDLVTLLQHFLI